MKPCTITMTHWSGDLPNVGHYLATRRGVASYLVTEVRRPKGKSVGHVAKFVCERRPRTELSERGTEVYWFKWNARGKKR